ncbi:glutamate--tRNA ligase [Alicyclobacillus sp. ALC3]|nr:glutamate--tRNA ligase [Alicyclobacillus sp. ALC3]
MNATESSESVRVRFAPSPTGALHIGGARTAYFNWLFARQRQGVFVLRIDDTDKARSTEASYQQILSSLNWLGLDWDEGPDVGGEFGPYRQSQRQSVYEAELARLVTASKVYPCFCTQDELAADRDAAQKQGLTPRYSGRCRHLSEAERARRLEQGEPHTYRLHSPQSGDVVVHDLIRGDVTFSADEVDDFIVWKADGTPTYHFASCIDDALMNITHIIRAEEHLSNTPRHIVLFQTLGYPVPAFAHVPMILAPDRSKLSKRHGATSVEEYRDAGILPEALVNYLLLLGFSPGEDREVLSRAEAVELFDLTRVSKNAAVYDVKKLEWLNGNYLRALSSDALLTLLWGPLVERAFVVADESAQRISWVRELIASMQSRAKSVNELVEGLEFYFHTPVSFDAKGVRKHFADSTVPTRLRQAADALAEVQPFVAPLIELKYHDLTVAWGVKPAALIHPTRLALTGRTVGPGLFELMALLGKSTCQDRLRQVAEAISHGKLEVLEN